MVTWKKNCSGGGKKHIFVGSLKAIGIEKGIATFGRRYGHNWIVAFQECLEWVEELIGCIPHKRRFYEQGLRAIKLIQQPF